MKENTLKISINAPVANVFEFTLNPKNTPKWIDFIKEETIDKRPPKLNTVYTNTSVDGKVNQYILTDLQLNKTFTLTQLDGTYSVRYIFRSLNKNRSCEFEYYEWEENGELKEPFTMEPLRKLKVILESDNETV